MSAPLIGVVTILYLGVCISLWIEGRYGMSLCFTGYALANVGLIIDVMKLDQIIRHLITSGNT